MAWGPPVFWLLYLTHLISSATPSPLSPQPHRTDPTYHILPCSCNFVHAVPSTENALTHLSTHAVVLSSLSLEDSLHLSPPLWCVLLDALSGGSHFPLLLEHFQTPVRIALLLFSMSFTELECGGDLLAVQDIMLNLWRWPLMLGSVGSNPSCPILLSRDLG